MPALENGYYAAWRHTCADEPDLVLFLGDYIYENPSPKDTSGLARVHDLPLPQNLATTARATPLQERS